jgi:hypothetical protein
MSSNLARKNNTLYTKAASVRLRLFVSMIAAIPQSRSGAAVDAGLPKTDCATAASNGYSCFMF